MAKKIIRVGLIGFRAVSTDYPLGGIEHWVTQIVNNLKEEFVFGIFTRKKYCKGGGSLSYLVKPYPGLWTKNAETLSHSLCSTITASFKFDIIHYHGNLAAFWSFIPKIFRKKVIVTLHGADWKRDKWSLPMRFVQRLALKIAMKFSDVVVSCSKYQAQELIKQFSRNVVVSFYRRVCSFQETESHP